MILKPERFTRIVQKIQKLKLVDKSVLWFAEYQMSTEEKRKRVYYTWIAFRHLRFNMSTIARQIEKNNIAVTIIIGKHDKIITHKNVKKLLRHLKYFKLEILEMGHGGLIRAALPFIK